MGNNSMSSKVNINTSFWLFSISVLFALTLPVLIRDGMFMDAMLYTSVSHNLSQGIGTFWFPQFSLHNIASLNSFHEQPPLVFGIQSLFFKVLGDSMYVERLYTFLTLIITAFLINVLWKDIYKDIAKLKKMGWLPILFWISIPVCFWSYSNNMHENTMGIFTLLAVIFGYRGLVSDKHHYLNYFLAGSFVFLATLSKGIPGFFPIAVPLLYWGFNRFISFNNILRALFVITLIPITAYVVLLLIPESSESLKIYFFERVLHRINEVPTVDSRFYILIKLLLELLPLGIVTSIILFFNFKSKQKTQINKLNDFWFFILVGLASSLPLMLTMVQKGFYFVPALPFFSIAFAILVGPIVVQFKDKLVTKTKFLFLVSSFLLLAVCIVTFMQVGKYSRNKELLEDVYKIGPVIPKKSIVSIPNDLWNEWDLQCYLARYYYISLETTKLEDYFIVEKQTKVDTLKGYEKILLQTHRFDLYKKLK
jgi:hypothetical protein